MISLLEPIQNECLYLYFKIMGKDSNVESDGKFLSSIWSWSWSNCHINKYLNYKYRDMNIIMMMHVAELLVIYEEMWVASSQSLWKFLNSYKNCTAH